MTGSQEGAGWTTYAKIVAIFAASIGMLALFALAGRGKVAEQGIDSVGLLIWSGLMLLGGVMAFRTGFQRYRERQLIRGTPTSKVRSLAVGDVEVKGTAHPVDEPLTAPITGKDVCIWELEIKEETSSGEEGSKWSTVLETRDQVPFHLDDGTGRVRVDPEEAMLTVEAEATRMLESGEAPPEHLSAWAKQQDWFAEDERGAEGSEEGTDGAGGKMQRKMVARAREQMTEPSSRDRRLTERVVPVGEEVYVFGGAHPVEGKAAPSNPDNLVIDVHEGTGKLMITDQGEAGFAEGKLVDTAFLLAAALLFIPIALWGLMFSLGIL